jgi:hypothetical protein
VNKHQQSYRAVTLSKLFYSSEKQIYFCFEGIALSLLGYELKMARPRKLKN